MGANYTRKLRVGTRGSALAIRQTTWAVERLRFLNPEIEAEIITIKTKGDQVTDVPLTQIGDKGLFVKDIEQALLDDAIDLAVHSMKDLPSELPDGLCIGAVPERLDPRDVVVSNGLGLMDLPRNARIGTGSLRRRAQLSNFRRDLQFFDLRGNLDTRLRKLDEGKFDAIVVACAGLERMGWTERIVEKIPLEVCLPAAGQGALAIEVREDDIEALGFLLALNHYESRAAVTAERSMIGALGGTCRVPMGACGVVEDGKLRLMGVVASPSGERLIREEISGDPEAAEEIGKELAVRLLSSGADDLIKRMEHW
ncbi:MAG: hydroxymethylbilane synthase [Armatimonadota bacterium]|nr:hydroxymethylbilane synthase [Armatimonadota bacterium]